MEVVEVTKSEYLSRLNILCQAAIDGNLDFSNITNLDYAIMVLAKFIAVKEEYIIKKKGLKKGSSKKLVDELSVNLTDMDDGFFNMILELGKNNFSGKIDLSDPKIDDYYFESGIHFIQNFRNSLCHGDFKLCMREDGIFFIQNDKMQVSISFLSQYLNVLMNDYLIDDDKKINKNLEKDEYLLLKEILEEISTQFKQNNNIKILLQSHLDMSEIIDKYKKNVMIEEKEPFFRQLVYDLTTLLKKEISKEYLPAMIYAYSIMSLSDYKTLEEMVSKNIKEFPDEFVSEYITYDLGELLQSAEYEKLDDSSYADGSVGKISIIKANETKVTQLESKKDKIQELLKELHDNLNNEEVFKEKLVSLIRTVAWLKYLLINRVRNSVDHFNIFADDECFNLCDKFDQSNDDTIHFRGTVSIENLYLIINQYRRKKAGLDSPDYKLDNLFDDILEFLGESSIDIINAIKEKCVIDGLLFEQVMSTFEQCKPKEK